MFDYAAYARQLRHELHQCPEIGFELTQTTSIVQQELERMVARELPPRDACLLNVGALSGSLGEEDFAFFSRKKPCAMLRLGISNGENPDTRVPLHNDHFDVDESCFKTGISVFVNFVPENQDGSSF